MNYVRAIRSGGLVWVCVITSFTVLEYVPVLKDSFLHQSAVVLLLMFVFATLAANIYYKNGNNNHGLLTGLMISATALVLDVLITVPFFEMPNGRGYVSFFTSPVLWLLVAVNVGVVWVYSMGARWTILKP